MDALQILELNECINGSVGGWFSYVPSEKLCQIKGPSVWEGLTNALKKERLCCIVEKICSWSEATWKELLQDQKRASAEQGNGQYGQSVH